MSTIRDEKELAEKLKHNESTLDIEGDLANKVIKIHSTGSVAWGLALGLITATVLTILATPTTFGTSAIVSMVSGTASAGILGAGAATSAVMIAVSAGGVDSLKSLRSYKIIKQSKNRVILKK